MSTLTTSQWQAVLAEISREISQGSFQTWFRNIELVKIDGPRVQIGVPNLFMKEWIGRHYLAPITRAVRTVTGEEPEVIIGISPRLYRSVQHADKPALAAPASASVPAATTAGAPEAAFAPRSGDWGVRLNREFTTESFVVGGCNRLAADAAQAVIESPGRSYNPLFLHGAPGLGKTHLLHSICHSMRRVHPEAAVLYLSCEEFTNAYVSAVQGSSLAAFRARCRGADCLAVDDVQFLAAKERTQEEFFHTFDTLLHSGRQVVLSADRHPRDLEGLPEKLRTRFLGGLVAQLGIPDEAARAEMVRAKALRRRLDLADEVVALVAARSAGSVRELEGAVAALAAAAAADGRSPDGGRARAVLRQLSAMREGPPGLDDVLRAVERRYGVSSEELRSACRARRLMVPRQVAMYLARRLLGLSLAEVGRQFGGRDHATVLYSERKVQKDMDGCLELRMAVDELSSELKG